MKIMIKPSDILERCLWDDYEYYCLDKKKVDIATVIEENKEFEITENDALVIGLIKCIETNNLVYKLNQYIQQYIGIKSFEYNDNKSIRYYLKKEMLISHIHKFAKKFPDCWNPRLDYKVALEDVIKYIEELNSNIENLKVTNYTDKFGTYDIIEVNHLNKILNYHN